MLWEILPGVQGAGVWWLQRKHAKRISFNSLHVQDQTKTCARKHGKENFTQ